MFKTLQNAFKVKEIRTRMMFTLFMLVIIRLGAQLPVPGVNSDYFQYFFSTGDSFNFFNAITGGSFEDFSIFALSITPYITSSIIMQLLTIAIPKLEEMNKEEDGKRKIAEITRYVTVALALIQAIAIAVGFGGSGLLENYTWYNVVVVVCALTAGSAFLMWIGEQITEKGVGNGISIVLLINILSRMPSDLGILYDKFMKSQSIPIQVIAFVVIAAVIIGMVVFVVLLNDAVRRIPVQYSQKVVGRRSVGGQGSHIPLKVNTGGVIPVIFASSIMSFPVVIAQFFDVDYTTFGGKILMMLSSSNWCVPKAPVYSIGLIIYIVLIVAFAYFYTAITFNPIEIATNMKKQGGFIPGIRPGKNTSDYLSRVLNNIVLIGAAGLTIVAVFPIVISGVFSVSRLSFGGTSIIIVVSVIMETIKQIESKMLVRNYKGFLND